MNQRLMHNVDRAVAQSLAALALSNGILGELSGFPEHRWRF